MTQSEVPLEQLPEIFDSFQYGSIPHILERIKSFETGAGGFRLYSCG